MYTTNKTTFESLYNVVIFALMGSLLISLSLVFVAIVGNIIHGDNGTVSSALSLSIMSLVPDMFLMVVLVAMTFCKIVFK